MSSTDTTSQHGKRFHFDIMVIGGGASGLQYILELSKINPCCKIALITKRAQNDCNSYLAQGGIAASNLQKKSLDQHLQDTIKAGCGLCNVETAKKIINYGHEGIESLIKSGVEFDTAGHGFDLAKEGGHSTRRIYHTDDMTGKSIMTALTEQVAKLNQVTIFERHIAVNLIVKKNETIGAYILDENSHKIHCFFANATILATGGAGKVFRYTTNLEVATGDGVAMAYRAGTKIINMEFYQFHPTLLYHTKINNFLITEALRGEGAYLRNAGTGERFMQKYAPEQMELATRDIVARANFNEIEISNANFVYLDIRHKSEKFLKNRFPTVFNQLLELGINISKEMIPVVPAAHYLCGGIATAVDGTTDIKRLYAIGETACTGFHGANRLASNSLLENLAMAHYCAQKSTKDIASPISTEITDTIKPWDSKNATDLRRATQINAHWRGLRGEMTSYAGIIRTEAGLKDLLKLITTRAAIIETYYWSHEITSDLIELRNITLIAKLITNASLKRKKSIGGHFRED